MYNKEQIYDEQIFPLMNKISEICIKHKIQVCADFLLTDTSDEKGALHCTTALNLDIDSDETIRDMYKVAYHGYIAIKSNNIYIEHI